ncbi:DUF411 domain-containing protein [Psychrobacter sp. DM4]|uniref:DUF411 domain-containing protein n=1 Tax=Psychrobacter sp. DM4 TaxID=3440637 RepID=UPI003F4FA7B8
MRRYTNTVANGYKKVSASALLLVATLTLTACSQPDTSVSNSTQPEPMLATQSAQSEQLQAQTSPISTNLGTQPTILQNVSATVYKDANCGCCKEWVSHAEDSGLSATAQDVADVSLFKDRYSVPQQMRSCHTTVTTDGYVFEGHVPAKHMAQFLADTPSDAIGLAVPSMPVGSPGMEYQDKFMPYKVMQLNQDGSTQVYAAIESPAQQL